MPDVVLGKPVHRPVAAEVKSGRLAIKGNEVGVLMLLWHRNEPCEEACIRLQSGTYSYNGQLVPKALIVLCGEQDQDTFIEITSTSKIYIILHPKQLPEAPSQPGA